MLVHHEIARSDESLGVQFNRFATLWTRDFIANRYIWSHRAKRRPTSIFPRAGAK